MVAVTTDFREYRRGLAPPDWSEQWKTTLAEVSRSMADRVDRAYLEAWQSKGGWAGLSFDPVADTGDQEILGLFSFSPEASGTQYIAALRAGGSSGSEDALVLGAIQTTSPLAIRVWALESGTLTAASLPLVLDIPPRHSFWARMRVEGTGAGAELSLKGWEFGEDEPSAWDQEGVSLSAFTILDTGNMVSLADAAQGDHRLHALSVATGGGTAPALPLSASLALERGRPWHLLRADVRDAVGDEVTLWYGERGYTPAAEDHPSGLSTDRIPPALEPDWEIESALGLDDFEGTSTERLQGLSLRDPGVAGAADVPLRPLREQVLDHDWKDGSLTLYAVPVTATSLRERVAIASGVSAKEPSVSGDRIDIEAESRLEVIRKRDIAVNHYVGCSGGWGVISGQTALISVPYIVAYDITSFTLMSRFRCPGFSTTGGELTMLWSRVGTTDEVWSRIYAVGDGSGRLQWIIGDGSSSSALATTDAATPLDDDQIHTLIAAIDDDRRFYFSIDGKKVAEGTPPFAAATPSAVLWIARNLEGWISDQRFIAGFLELDDAASLQGVRPANEEVDSSYRGYWPLDDGAGTAATDQSGHANHGASTGTEDTDFEWAPTDLGMTEQAGRAMPWAHGQIFNAPADRHDEQRARYRLTDRAITTPSADVQVRTRGFEVTHTSLEEGVVGFGSELDEPVTWGQAVEHRYPEVLREVFQVRAGLTLGTEVDDEAITALGRLFSGGAAIAGEAGGDTPKVGDLLDRFVGGFGVHIRQSADGLLEPGILLPPLSPGPFGDPALEWLGLPRPIVVPPPDTTRYADYTVVVWIKIWSLYGDLGTFGADTGNVGAIIASHYEPGVADLRYFLATDGGERGGIVFGDDVSSELFVSAPGALPSDEWVMIAGRADATAGARKIFRALAGETTVEEVASGSYSGVVDAERPGDQYTSVGAASDGSSSLSGGVAHFAFYGAALSTGQLDAIAAAGPDGHTSDRVHHLPLTEGDGPFVRDVDTGIRSILLGQRWAPRLVVDLHSHADSVQLLEERRVSPAKSIRALYRPNFRPLDGGDLAAELNAAERRAMAQEAREVSWDRGPDAGRDLELRTPFYLRTGGERALSIARLRFEPDRRARDLRLNNGGRSLAHMDEVRVDNLPGGESWTGRVVGLVRDPDGTDADLWG